mmetsp:Transcript_11916/g.19746  ORF Transcript_11916/g.19746 Transcript_11916/m.19746 type:complete len:235 (-) Transcript_11916:54-758(-)|eukprot:CAMPEP_0119022394 /NCGR_PEP_ID=MMETSP1176-20130426/27929_1 /TAXON_ID=265551 /ORGANISM="Synedropsis recta cf, Strain CCMP1620" /LENGTH=234 /DNA_ID=CAMNT_0006977243 /DNA_START=34 /DNA_END=738 /DNA_ORIENTATION=+
MMEVMSNFPSQFGDQTSEKPIDSFEAAIDKITFPRNPLQQQQEETPTDMRDIFINAFDDEDEEDDQPDVRANVTPKRFDIICGRDKLSHAHVGNKRFRIVVEMNRERYQTAPSRDEKTRITCDIVSMIRSCRPGGRFLKMDEMEDSNTGTWKDVGDDYAREKVSHALRSAKDPSRKRTRKKRKSVVKSHSGEENDVFAALLEDQQKIFNELVEEMEGGRSKKRHRRDSSGSDGS